MSGDRLAQIERRLQACAEDVRGRPFSHPIGVGWYAEDVLALVEIAKAARGVMYAEFENADEVLVPKDDFDALRSALARLDSGAAQEQT